MEKTDTIYKRLFNRYVVLFFLTFTLGYVFNSLNIQALVSEIPEKVRLGETVFTSDDVIYIKPAIHFVNGKGWTDGSVGRQQYFSRPPGYSLFIVPFYALFGLKQGLFFLKFAQLLLFSLSSVCMLKLLEKQTSFRRISWFVALLYGVFPIACGFVFYTLTESITPAILIFHLYFLQKKIEILQYLDFFGLHRNFSYYLPLAPFLSVSIIDSH
jgi:hypothetical protein